MYITLFRIKTTVKLACVMAGFYSFFLVILVYSLYVLIYSESNIREYGEMTFLQAYIIALVAIFASYQVVLLEGFYAKERKYVSKTLNESEAVDYMHTLLATKPEVYTFMECYHYETKTKQVRTYYFPKVQNIIHN